MKNLFEKFLSAHKKHEILNKLEAAGLTDELVQKIINSNNNEIATKIVKIIRLITKTTTSQKRAREIMGTNYFGIKEALQHFKITPTKHQIAKLSEIPWSEITLKQCKDTHVLVSVFPISILEIKDKISKSNFPDEKHLFYDQNWYDNQFFARENGKTEWQLVRKTPIENSMSKTYNEQQTLLSEKEKIPKARIMVYTIVGHFLATGERLFEKNQTRCIDMDSKGELITDNHIIVGEADFTGLYIGSWPDKCLHSYIGLASTKKSDI